MARKKVDREQLTRLTELADGLRGADGKPSESEVSLAPDLCELLDIEEDDDYPETAGGGRMVPASLICEAADRIRQDDSRRRPIRRATEEEINPSDPENTSADREAQRLNPGERTELNTEQPRVPASAATPQADAQNEEKGVKSSRPPRQGGR